MERGSVSPGTTQSQELSSKGPPKIGLLAAGGSCGEIREALATVSALPAR